MAPTFADSEALRARNLDASLPLLAARHRIVSAMERGASTSRSDVQVVAIGTDAILRALIAKTRQCREAVSITVGTSRDSLLTGVDIDRVALSRGVQMISVHDLASCEPEALDLMLEQRAMPRYVGVAALQMRIWDRQQVALEGPAIKGQRSLLVAGAADVVAAAWHYWQAVVDTAAPVRALAAASPMHQLSARQREIAELLADDITDQDIAAAIGISVRTVRYEIAAILKQIGARSRFGAGFRLGRASMRQVPVGSGDDISERALSPAHLDAAGQGEIRRGLPGRVPLPRQARSSAG